MRRKLPIRTRGRQQSSPPDSGSVRGEPDARDGIRQAFSGELDGEPAVVGRAHAGGDAHALLDRPDGGHEERTERVEDLRAPLERALDLDAEALGGLSTSQITQSEVTAGECGRAQARPGRWLVGSSRRRRWQSSSRASSDDVLGPLREERRACARPAGGRVVHNAIPRPPPPRVAM